MSVGPGWIGMTSQVEYYLSIVGADQDEQGNYLLVGETESDAPSSFMGAGVETLIPSGCCYLVKGKRCNLAQGLASTSYGQKITVIS